MNTAIVLLTFHTLSQTTAIVVKDYVIQVQPPSVTIPPAFPPHIHRESRHYEDGNTHMNKDTAHGSGDHKHSSGGSSVGHHETGKSGHELNEMAKKEHGSHEGDKGVYSESAHSEKGEGHQMDQKHHAHHKTGANKKRKKVLKGFHEEYHKDEEKSTGGHWKHEHSEGKYIKFGKKRGKGGAKNSKKSDEVKKRNDDGDPAIGFPNMDQVMTVEWSTKKKPVYRVINHSLFRMQ